MKALTIKQPYASLIVNNYKEYEFRSWNTNYRGKILIHAGLSKYSNLNDFNMYNLDYIYGAIIGEAYIVDSIKVDKEFDSYLHKLNNLVYAGDHVDLYAWKLENIVKYDKPIFVKGKLGLWNYE
ncbi:MAG: ASCH domain-containing protein [Bacilli bacterium]|nr:ASCH domain-containing protein [Bacilli bacterium]